MSGLRIHTSAPWLTLSIVVACCLSLLAPVASALASTDLTGGDDAVVVNTNGDLIRLRTKPGLNGAVVGEFPGGTTVDVVDGPRISDDGAAWYRVSIDGQSGYMAAEFLAPAGSTEPAPVDEPAVGVETNPGPTVITGTATIVDTNGDPIRCRADASIDADIIGELFEGESVELAGESSGDWQPVRCAGQNGWVHIDFIGSSVQTAEADEPVVADDVDSVVIAAEITGSGTITGTNGDGVRCRSRASLDGGVITVLGEGANVDLRGAQNGDWMPVTCDGKKGYVWAEFVSTSGSDSGGDSSTGTGTIVHTNGDGLRCRAEGSFDGAVITVLVEGEEVDLRGSQQGEWQPVYCDGAKGYVHADYIDTSGGSSGGGDGGNSPGLQNGDVAQVAGTGGDGVRLRSAASSSASVITVLSEGTTVDVRRGSSGDWVAVEHRGSSGFVHGDYLVEASSGGDGGEEPTGELSSGDHAMVTDTLNFRSGANTSAAVLGVALEGIVVLVTGRRDNGYFPVEWGGTDGFMHGDYLAWTDDPLSPGASGVGGDAGDGAPSSIGQAMVDYAMNYLGYPYIWATAGPNSFDCSGFTYWVTKHVLGEDIGRGLWTQVVAGTPVSYGNLKPGDLVFFQNTYTWGLSHVGIYIGNNRFIHAENENTGVRISSITSTYYSTRYYGAVRLG